MHDDRKGEIFPGRRILHRRRGRCPLASTSFSCLDARKGCEKKIKASPRPGSLAGYRILSLFVFCFLLSSVGAQKHTPSKRPARGGCRMMGRGKIFQAYGYIFGGRAFVSSGDAWWAYSIRPYPTGRRCLLFIPTTFTTYPGFFVVHLSFFDVPCRGVSHTPSKRPARGGCMTMGRGKFFQACGYIFGKTVFAPCGGTWWAYSIRPYPTGRRKMPDTCRISPRIS